MSLFQLSAVDNGHRCGRHELVVQPVVVAYHKCSGKVLDHRMSSSVTMPTVSLSKVLSIYLHSSQDCIDMTMSFLTTVCIIFHVLPNTVLYSVFPDPCTIVGL